MRTWSEAAKAAVLFVLACRNSPLDPGQRTAENLGRREAAFAQGADAERVVALGEPATVLVGDEGAVKPCRIGKAQCAVEQNLACGGLEQIGASNDFGDMHRGVIDYAGELITRHPIPAPDDEVSEIAAGNESLRAEVEIVELDRFAVVYANPPVRVRSPAAFRPAALKGRHMRS